MKTQILRRLAPWKVRNLQRRALRQDALTEAAAIVDDVKARGLEAMIEHAVELGDLEPGQAWLKGPDDFKTAFNALEPSQRSLIERCAQRIRTFALAQKNCLKELKQEIAGGYAGHTIQPMQSAGCYAPGGRYPLPSSVLMTAITARAAGVNQVWVASPRPSLITLAACGAADADGLLAVGGAQAVAALHLGIDPVPACDILVGPGNAWVTAAKHIVSADTAIDMLAGPSELLILTDGSAYPAWVAADLLAQAEHDPMALPMLVSTCEKLLEDVDRELSRQLETLPTAAVARKALRNGFGVLACNLDEAIELSDRIAPEHLELLLEDPHGTVGRLRHYGALFIGSAAAEVLGDYAAGPNHVLPTGTTARFTGGLSVLSFLKVRTWIDIENPDQSHPLYEDAAQLARIEGLEAHARAAEMRIRAR